MVAINKNTIYLPKTSYKYYYIIKYMDKFYCGDFICYNLLSSSTQRMNICENYISPYR